MKNFLQRKGVDVLKTIIGGLALTIALASPVITSSQTSAIKINAGLWEHSFTLNSGNGEMEQAMKQMQAQMAKMSPAERKQIEAAMAQSGVSFGPKGNSVKVCLTKEEVERETPPPAQDGCSQTAKRTGNTWNLSFKCPGPPPSSGDGTITYKSATAYSGVLNATTTDRGKTEKVQMSITGQWLGANCGNVKPIKP
jgi:hypothetical protein